ncbi:MAG TPA: GIY-YIG nuclease family protein [Candidatus Omnitrophota bacterium]|nr:GIY-YIG nuclease family protein [Candidatus Omnitrophota bacterium]
MWFVYVLECGNGALYTGMTNNLEKRIKEHKAGKGGKFTRSFKVRRLVYSETCATKSKALKREAEIKKWSRNKKIKLIQSKNK